MTDDDSLTEELPVTKRARVTAAHDNNNNNDDDDDDATEALPPRVTQTPRSTRAARPSPSTCHFVNIAKRRTTWAHGVDMATLFSAPLSEAADCAIERAVLGTYLFDVGFVDEFAPALRRARQVTLVHGSTVSGDEIAALLPNFRVVRPDVAVNFGDSMHHAKYFLLLWPNTLRVVVSTANATDDYHRRSNQIWMQDFPRCATRTSSSKGLDFLDQLARFVAAVGLRDWVGVLSAHNFDAVQVWLVCSVPGVHTGADMSRWGHLRVRALLRRLQPLPATFLRPSLMAQFSSLGRMSDTWLYEQWMTSMMPPAAASSTEPQGGGGKAAQLKLLRTAMAERLFLVWPTVAFVRDSFFGYPMGLSICGTRSSFDLDCVRTRFFKYLPQNATRGDLSPHMKSYALFDGSVRGKAAETPVPLAYYLSTSANLSKQAWGELQKDESQFSVKNFEMGVIFLANEVDALSTAPRRPLLASDRGADRAASLDMPLIVDVRNLQPIRYVPDNDDEQPWAFDLQYHRRDRFGATNEPVRQTNRFARPSRPSS